MKKHFLKMLIMVSCLFLTFSCQKTTDSITESDTIALKAIDTDESEDDYYTHAELVLMERF